MASELITQAFGPNANLYDILEVDRNVDNTKLRKAYYKRALIYHPDKNNNDEETKLKFQAVSLAYQILSDPDKRSHYDETDELDDEDEDNLCRGGVEQWQQYFRNLFPRVTVEDIQSFETKYKGSEEERKDVLKYYKICKGNLNDMLTCVMLSEEEDKERWVRDFIRPAVRSGDVPKYDDMLKETMKSEDMDVDSEDTVTDDENYAKKKTKKSKRKNNASKKEKEAKEAEDLMAKIRGNAMARREKAFEDMMAGIEDRYSGGKKTNKRKKARDPPDIPDDEFDKIRNRVEANRKSNARKKK